MYNPKNVVIGLKMAHTPELASSFEFAVLILTMPELRFRKFLYIALILVDFGRLMAERWQNALEKRKVLTPFLVPAHLF
jgi:hypothetical protein